MSHTVVWIMNAKGTYIVKNDKAKPSGLAFFVFTFKQMTRNLIPDSINSWS